MKFDINKEFSFSQVFEFVKNKLAALLNFIKKLDKSNIKTFKYKGRNIRVNAMRLCFIVAVFAILLALFVNIVVIPNTTYRSYSDIEFDTGGQYIHYAFGNDILLLNNNGIKLVNNKGSEKWSRQMTLTNPSVSISGKYMLLADLDGSNSLNLYNLKGKNIITYPITTDILSAKVSKNGIVAAAIAEEGYKGSVVVYNKKGDELFKWNSGEGYIIDIDISSDGKSVAAAQMMSDGDETYSKIHIINISNGKETGCYVCEDSLVAKVTFDNRDNIIAVAQNKVYGINKKGNCGYEIDLAGKSPVSYYVENCDYLVFHCKDSRGNSVLEIYNNRGKLLGSYTSSDSITQVSCNDDMIVASTSRSVMHISCKGRLKKRVEITHDIMSIGIYGNNRNVLVLGGNKADIVRVR